MIKQAIIPLAGLGTRLLPLTSVFPKELLPINGKPGIEYILDECIEADVKEIIFIISKKKEVIKDVVEEVAQVLNPLDQYQEDIKKKRQEQLDKRSQINIGNQLRFSATVKKDPDRGMGWVNASGSINQGKLGHSQSWKFKSSKKYEYY